MARAKAERTRSKSAILEDISQGIERLQSFIPEIEDLGRDGFPYLEGARTRTEMQLKECIRKTFGEKSSEFQAYRQRRLSVDTPTDTKQTVALIKRLIASLEDKKLEVQGLKPPPPPTEEAPPPKPPTTRPQMALVPPSTPSAHVMIAPAAPAPPPPITMSVALTTNLDMTQASVGSPPIAPNNPVTAPEPPKRQPELATPLEASIPSPQVDQRSPVPDTAPPVVVHAPEANRPAAFPKATPPQPPMPGQTSTAVPSPDLQVTTPATEVTPENKPPSKKEKDARPTPQPTDDPSEIVKSLCKRFHMIARQLRLRGEYRATLNVEDEIDVQDLLHALLRLHFDDIETTEWLPSYANSAPRLMFLLNDGRLAVVVKKTRSGLNAKDLAEQLHIDVEHCGTLKRCSTLLCFVYDPEGRIGNPRGLEADLMSISDQLTAEVYIAPK
jgi:hypothetical protein